MPGNNPKILLGMLVSNGDCLMATVLARQIKNDYPGCHLTWAISSFCRMMIENNPNIDEVWELQFTDKKEALNEGWHRFAEVAMVKKAKGEFDEVFLTQIYPSNVHHYDGTTRGTIYGAYPKPVTVEARPDLYLNQTEVRNVEKFAVDHELKKYQRVILFECTPLSGQSFITPDWALQVSAALVKSFENLLIIISTHLELLSPHERIIIANRITLRENAELTKYCHLLIGCSSGITWVAVSSWSKRLPMVQFLRRGVGFAFASVVYDHQWWKIDNSEIIETTIRDRLDAVNLIGDVIKNGVVTIKPVYHQRLTPRFISLLKYSFMFFRKGKLSKSIAMIRNFTRRNYTNRK